jgi:hypothetical protein
MNQQFKDLVDTLDKKYQALMSMDPVIADKIQPNTPVGGVYLFSEEERHLYAGRTKRKISVRIRNHFNSANDCPFAWLLARHKTGKKASYKKKGSRADLLSDPTFKAIYDSARNRIRKMQVRYVCEPDPLRQALLEIYVSVAAQTKFNDFDTH